MSPQQLERRVRFLSAYAVGTTLCFALLLLAAFSNDRTRFDVIDVERINVVGPDGTLKVVIANEERFPGVVLNGEELTSGGRAHGFLFFNSEEDEAGGLIFRSRRTEGGIYSSGHLSLDRFESDQVVALNTFDAPGQHGAALMFNDFPLASRGTDGVREVRRVFVGKYEGDAWLALHDTTGQVRAQLMVDALGTPRLEFFDADGNVTHRLPEE